MAGGHGAMSAVKKGQDLTQPGQTDDLNKVIQESYKPLEKQWDQRKKELREQLKREDEEKAKKSMTMP